MLDATGQTVNLALAGALTDNNAGVNNITATTLNISGNQAVTSIETTVTNLDLTTAATSITDLAGGLTLKDSTVTGQLDLETKGGGLLLDDLLDATGQMVNLVLAGALTDNNAGANNITATTLNISGNNAVTSIETTVTSLDLTTAATPITDLAGGLILTDSVVTGQLDLTTTGGGLALHELTAASQTVNFALGGALTDANGSPTNNLTATTLNITGNAAVGVGDAIELTIANLDLTTAQTNVTNAGTLTLNDSTVTGQLDLATTAGGALKLDELTATGQTVNTVIAGSIDDDNTGTNNITAATWFATANGGIGSADQIETTVTTLDVTNGTSGNVDVLEADGATVTNLDLTAGAGTVTLTSTTGDIGLNNDAVNGNGGLVTLNALAGNILDADTGTTASVSNAGNVSLIAAKDIGTGADSVDVAITGGGTLSVSATGSDIFVNSPTVDLTVSAITTKAAQADTVALKTQGSGNLILPAGLVFTGTATDVFDLDSASGNIDVNTALSIGSIDATSAGGTIILRQNVTTGAVAGVVSNGTTTLDGLTIDTTTGSGVVTFNGATDVQTGALIVNAGGTIAFPNGTFTSQGQDVTFNGAAQMQTPVTFTTNNGTLLFSGTVDSQGGNHDLTVLAGTGNVSLQGVVGGTTPLGNFTVGTGAPPPPPPPPPLVQPPQGANSVTLGVAGGGNETFTITGDLTVTANEIDFRGGDNSITTSGAGRATLRPSPTVTTVTLGGPEAGSLTISSTDFAALGDGWSKIDIGVFTTPVDTIFEGAQLTGAASVKDPLFINGSATVNSGPAAVIGDGSITFTDNVLVQTANFGAAGTDTIFQQKVIIGADNLLILGKNIVFGSDLASIDNATTQANGPHSLTLTTTGDVFMDGPIGSTFSNVAKTIDAKALGTLTINAPRVNIGVDVGAGADVRPVPPVLTETASVTPVIESLTITTATTVKFNGIKSNVVNGGVNINGGVAVTTPNGGSLVINGGGNPVILGGNKTATISPTSLDINNSGVTSLAGTFDTGGNTIDLTGAPNISLLDDTIIQSNVSFASTVTGTAANLIFHQNVAILGGTTFGIGAGTFTANKNIAHGANQLVIGADEIELLGGDNSVTGINGQIALAPGNAGSSIGINGGAGVLQLSNADLKAVANGHSLIVIGRADGTGGGNINSPEATPFIFMDNLAIVSPLGGAFALDATDTAIVVNGGGFLLNAQIADADSNLKIATTGGVSLDANSGSVAALDIGFFPATDNLVIAGDTILSSATNTLRLPASVTGTANLAINPPGNSGNGTDLTFAQITGAKADFVNSDSFTKFGGHLIVGGFTQDPVLGTPDLGTSATERDAIINGATVTFQDPLTTNGPITVLARDINLFADITAGRSGEAGNELVFLAVGDPVMGSGTINGPVANNEEVTLSGSNAFFASTGEFTNADKVELSLGGGDLLVFTAGDAPDFSTASDANSVEEDPTSFQILDGLAVANAGANFAASFDVNSLQSQLITFDIRAELQNTGDLILFDLSIFESELEIIGTIGRGVAMDISQCEELEGCAPFATEESLDAFIAGLDERIAELQRRKAAGQGDAGRIQTLLDGFTAERDYFDTTYRDQLEAYLDEGDDFDDFEDDFDEDFGDAPGQGLSAKALAVNAYQWVEELGKLIWSGDRALPSAHRRY